MTITFSLTMPFMLENMASADAIISMGMGKPSFVKNALYSFGRKFLHQHFTTAFKAMR